MKFECNEILFAFEQLHTKDKIITFDLCFVFVFTVVYFFFLISYFYFSIMTACVKINDVVFNMLCLAGYLPSLHKQGMLLLFNEFGRIKRQAYIVYVIFI